MVEEEPITGLEKAVVDSSPANLLGKGAAQSLNGSSPGNLFNTTSRQIARSARRKVEELKVATQEIGTQLQKGANKRVQQFVQKAPEKIVKRGLKLVPEGKLFPTRSKGIFKGGAFQQSNR